jgi:hypothetical protein
MNTHSQRIEIRAHREPWLRDSISIRLAHITEQNGVTKVALAEPMVLKTLTEEDQCRELPPTMRLSPDDAQQFMDELWRTGIRPTEGAGSVGQIGAVKAHLEDMRTLVFKKPSA